VPAAARSGVRALPERAMKIEYASETLGNDAAGDFITPAVGRAHARLVQTEDLLGGANPAHFARGNARNTISFIVEEEHASLAAAVEHVFSFPDSLPGTGELRLTEGTTSWHILDACLSGVELVGLTGRSTALKYNFTGGAVTQAA